MSATAIADDPTLADQGFAVRLDNFEGPFDLLLQLIGRRKLDITEVALSQVTDEFIAQVKLRRTSGSGSGAPSSETADASAAPEPWDLDQTTSFLVVAATLLDLKAARLLPQGDIEDEEDLALLEARDLLFARLLQYRAYKQVAGIFAERIDHESRRHPRSVSLEPRYAGLLPDVLIGLGLDEFARLAATALAPKPELELTLSHIHAPVVSVREQATLVIAALRGRRALTFRSLAADAPDLITRVARFLALLELFREGVVAFDQVTPLGELTVRWTAADDAEVEITDEFDGGGEPAESAERGPTADSAGQVPTAGDSPADGPGMLDADQPPSAMPSRPEESDV